jgi:hypothetical protein
MIKLILTFTIAAFFMQAQAQNLRGIDISISVTTSLHEAYPSILADWSKDGDNFEAKYKADSLNRTVTYNSSGILIETNTEILEAALPVPVMEYLNENYKDQEVNEISKITNANGIVIYETKIKVMDLTFDSSGKFVKTVMN